MIFYLIGFIVFYFTAKLITKRVHKEDWTPMHRAVVLTLAFSSWLGIAIGCLVYVITTYSPINDERVAKW